MKSNNNQISLHRPLIDVEKEPGRDGASSLPLIYFMLGFALGCAMTSFLWASFLSDNSSSKDEVLFVVTEDEHTFLRLVALGAHEWEIACAHEAGSNGLSREAMTDDCVLELEGRPDMFKKQETTK